MQALKGKQLVFAGAGLGTMSFLMHLLRSGMDLPERIVLIDEDKKNRNDRTWCFWEREAGVFESIVSKQWHHLQFNSRYYNGSLEMQDYVYKMIRGIDLYKFFQEKIKAYPAVEWIHATVRSITATEAGDVKVSLADGTLLDYKNAIAFNNIPPKASNEKGDIHLLQHFKGWTIETPAPCFDPTKATLMDFRISQEHGTSFVYVMPLTATKALVEFTLFTENILEDAEYNKWLQQYCEKVLLLNHFVIADQEFGVIPMSNQSFPMQVNRVWQLGAAGGAIKASSGYTFQFVQKQAAQLIGIFRSGQFPPRSFLYLLKKRLLDGDKVFARLFEKNTAAKVFSFLDNETSLKDELPILWSLPTWPFLKSALAKRPTPKG